MNTRLIDADRLRFTESPPKLRNINKYHTVKARRTSSEDAT